MAATAVFFVPMNAMRQLMLEGSVALLVLSALGIISAWGWSRLMDRANDRRVFSSWHRVLQEIQRDPTAAAIYYGARWVGICIVVAWLFSRPV